MEIKLDERYFITADGRNYTLRRRTRPRGGDKRGDLTEGFMEIPDDLQDGLPDGLPDDDEAEIASRKRTGGRAIGYYSDLRGAVTRYIEETKPQEKAESLLEYVRMAEQADKKAVEAIMEAIRIQKNI